MVEEGQSISVSRGEEEEEGVAGKEKGGSKWLMREFVQVNLGF